MWLGGRYILWNFEFLRGFCGFNKIIFDVSSLEFYKK
jgi:hypothetical protein